LQIAVSERRPHLNAQQESGVGIQDSRDTTPIAKSEHADLPAPTIPDPIAQSTPLASQPTEAGVVDDAAKPHDAANLPLPPGESRGTGASAWPRIIVVAYATIVALLAVWYAIGFLALVRLDRTARAVPDAVAAVFRAISSNSPSPLAGEGRGKGDLSPLSPGGRGAGGEGALCIRRSAVGQFGRARLPSSRRLSVN
jgi:hypothetical protein